MRIMITRCLLALALGLVGGGPVWNWGAPVCAVVGEPENPKSTSTTTRSETLKAWHVLNRLAFGPRPGQVEGVVKSGVKEWIERQLDPASIDDSELESRLRDYPSLKMDLKKTYEVYWPDLPENFDERPQKVRDEFFEHRNRQYRRVQNELLDSVILRAVYSKRQFQEVIVEFWRNHFNIDRTKGFCRLFANHYEESVIRKHAFGRFESMLIASARHPAMSIYLDNEYSQKPLTKDERKVLEQIRKRRLKDPNAQFGLVANRISRHRGLNENYARELMELHTLGVDNYYDQRDVRELARVLTGWTHGWEGEPYESAYGFHFEKTYHDFRPKRVLGMKLRGKGGEAEGVKVIRQLARHPGTAQFIAGKLCRYLVSDHPPQALVDRVAETFRESGGELPQVYRAIVLSPEFLSLERARSKFKSPFEFVVSAFRGTDASLTRFRDTLFRLARMGQPIYECEDPTGYFDQTEAWLDPGVFVHRWDFALSLVAGKIKGARVKEELFESWGAGLDGRERAIANLLPVPPAERARRVLDQTSDLKQFTGILLGLPEFQKQ